MYCTWEFHCGWRICDLERHYHLLFGVVKEECTMVVVFVFGNDFRLCVKLQSIIGGQQSSFRAPVIISKEHVFLNLRVNWIIS